MNMQQSVKTCFRKYAKFSGRASRSEYWWFLLFGLLAGFVLGFIESFSSAIVGRTMHPFLTISNFLALMVLLPSFAVVWRRLHDTGRPGWFFLLPYVIGFIIVTVASLVLSQSSQRDNFTLGFWFAFVFMVIPNLINIYWLTRPSQPGPNKYGPNPHEVTK